MSESLKGKEYLLWESSIIVLYLMESLREKKKKKVKQMSSDLELGT